MPEVEVHFKFAGGVQTKSDPKSVPTTSLLTLENGVFTKAISIQKRNGYADIGQVIDVENTTVSDPIRVAARGDELLEFTERRCYSRHTGTGKWSDVGAVYSAVGTDRPLVTTGTQQTAPDHATLAGVTVTAWEDSAGGVWWSTIDATTGRIYRAATQASSTGISPRCVPCGTNLHIYYAVAASHNLFVIVVNPASPGAAVAPAVLTTDLDSTDAIYDACPTQRAGTPAAIAWFESTTTNIRVGYVDQSGVLGVPLLGDPITQTVAASRLAGSPLAISVAFSDGANADRIALAYVKSGPLATVSFLSGGNLTVNSIAVVSSFTAYTPASVTRVAIAGTVGGAGGSYACWSAWEESSATASQRFVVDVLVDSIAGATGPAGGDGKILSVGLAARAFTIGADVFVTCVHDTTYFNTYVTFKLTNPEGDGFVPVGRHLPAQAAGAPSRRHLPSAHVSGRVVEIALPQRQRLISENNDKFTETSIRLVAMDFDNDLSHQSAQFGRGLYMAGACPMHYDGLLWTELGFHVGPELIAAVKAGGGSMTSSTTYLYVAWYEWTDAQGEIHLGPTSNGTLVTMGGGDTQVTLTLPTCRLTLKPGVRIQVARSLAAKTGNTDQLKRVTSLDVTAGGAANGYVANDTTVDTVAFLDRMSDATLATFDEIYTDGGILSNDPTPLGSAIWRGKDRLFATDPSDGSIVRYSQPFSDGYGVQWPPDLFLRVDLQSGDVMAGASRDNRVVLWTERGIYTFAGDGPDQTGATDTSGFSSVQVIPSDVGCTDPQSIVRTPNGDMFKSGKGIYLLGNDFSTSYIGAPVEKYNSQTIRRGIALPNRTQVVFLTDSGLTLLFDYLFSQWSTFTNHTGLDAAVVSDQLYYLRTDGRMFAETIGVFSDAGTRIRLRLETAWIHMTDQLQGFHSFSCIHLLGTWVSAHQLGIQYQTDYTPGWTDSVWYDATGLSSSAGWITGSGANPVGQEPISGTQYGDGQYGDGQYGGTAPGEYVWRLDLYETGESIQFRFEDFEAAGYVGASFELTEMIITGTILGNIRRPMTAGRSA